MLSGKSRSSMCKYMGQAIRLPYIDMHTDTKQNVKIFFLQTMSKSERESRQNVEAVTTAVMQNIRNAPVTRHQRGCRGCPLKIISCTVANISRYFTMQAKYQHKLNRICTHIFILFFFL